MAFFSDFKELFTNAAQSVSSKTRDSVEISRLAGESRSVANEISSLYEQIGRLYVDSEGRDVQELSALARRVLDLRERLEEIERQRLQLKNQCRCPACGAASSRDARFCAACGRRMPEAQEAEAAPDLEDVHYCPECGAMKKEKDGFCPVCGHNPGAAASETEKKPETPPQPRRMVFSSDDFGDEAPDDFEAD